MKCANKFETKFSAYLVRDRSALNRYLGSLLILLGSFVAIYILDHFQISRLYSLMLLATLASAIHGGLGPSILCGILGAIAVNVHFGASQPSANGIFDLNGAFFIRVAINMTVSLIVAFVISEIKALYKIIERSKVSAEFANSQKDNLIRVIAHDLRNPIGVIMGYSDMLNARSLSEEMTREVAQKISAISMELALLIEDLLQKSSFDGQAIPDELKSVRIDRLLEAVIDNQSVYAARKDITIDFKGPGKNHPRASVKGDARKIARIFQNLIDNAIKYSPISSRIRIEMNVLASNLQVRFVDHGPGIHPEDVDKLFKPLGLTRNQTTSKEGSTGLGLAICKDLAEAMGGTITFTNLYPRGSIFTLSLPTYMNLMSTPSANRVSSVSEARAGATAI